MEFSDDENVNKGHRRSHVPSTRGRKRSNVPGRKNIETGTQRQREKVHSGTEKDDKNVDIRSDNKFKNLQAAEDKKHTMESLFDRLSLIIAVIAIGVALYTHFEKPLKIELKDFHELQQFTEELSKRLSSVESSLEDAKQITASVDDHFSPVENMQFENNRDRITERNLSGQVNNNEELKVLKDEVQKLKDELAVKFGDIKDMQREHTELQTNVMTIEGKLGKQSQFVKKKCAEVSKQMSQHNKTLRGLNLSVENLGSTLDGLNVSVESLGSTQSKLNVSVENLDSALSSLNVSVENLDSTLNKLNVSVENHGITLNKLNVSVENLGSTQSKLNVSVENLDSALSSLNVSVENLGSTLNKLIVSVENLGSTQSKLNVSVGNLGSTLNKLNVSVENLGSTQSKLNVSVENLDSALSSLNVSVENLGSTLNKLNVSVENLGSTQSKLNVSVENLDNALSSLNVSVVNHDSALSSLNVSVENLGSTLNKLNVSAENLGSTQSKLNVSVENISSALSKLNVSVENRVRAAELDLSGQIDANNKEIEALKEEAQKLTANVTTLEEKLEEQSHFAEKKNTEVVKQISQHNETLNDLNVSVENLGSALSSMNVSVENLCCNISSLNVSVYSLRSNMKQLSENMTGISIETTVLDKRTEDIVENMFDKGSMIVVIMINTTLLVLVIIYLVANRYTTRHLSGNVDSEQQQVDQNPAPYSTAGKIMNQVRFHPHLERKLCVVSFYEETHPLHMRITQSITQQLNMELLEFIIRRHENILEFSPVFLYFLFVDFNERNVILEDPTLGLGDLRLTTVQAIQKMGGKIVIFYVRDPNSRQLDSTKLYNEDLASVTRQRELSALNRLSRFISAYDQLTDYQKAHLRRIVVQELNGR